MAQEADARQYELSVGADAGRHFWSAYSSLTMAPFGSVTEDGFRLRTSGGYSSYTYAGQRLAGAGSQLFKFHGTASFADLLLGYHQQLGPVTLKLYGGATATQNAIDPADPEAQVQGTDIGGKALLESWWTIGEHSWTSLDLSYASLHQDYAGRLRLGWRLLPALSLGIEAGAAGNVDGDQGRGGGFVRYEWQDGEISASAGVMTDWAGIDKLDSRGAFATVSWLSRF